MNRRDFLKFIPPSLMAALLASHVGKEDGMSFSDLITKLGRGETLSASEVESLRQEARAIDEVKALVKTWVNPGTSRAIFTPPLETIYSTVLNADTASISIRIPGSYKHLLVMGSGRVTGAGTSAQYLLAQFNGDTAGNYNQEKLDAGGATVTAAFVAGQVGALVGMAVEGGVADVDDTASFFALIPHYLSVYEKSVLMFAHYSGSVNFTGSVWTGNTSIEQIDFVPVTDTFASGFLLSVYGLK